MKHLTQEPETPSITILKATTSFPSVLVEDMVLESGQDRLDEVSSSPVQGKYPFRSSSKTSVGAFHQIRFGKGGDGQGTKLFGYKTFSYKTFSYRTFSYKDLHLHKTFS